MGDNNESIGGISVEVVGDYSKLQADLEGAKQVAAEAGAEIATALSDGAAGADALSGAISAASVGMEGFEAQIQALVASGSTLAEALAAVQGGAEEIATGVSAAGQAAAEAATQMDLFDQALEVPFADAAGQLNLFATELEPIPAAAQEAAQATEQLAQGEKAAGDSAQEASEGTHKFLTAMLELAGIELTLQALKDFVTEAVEVFAATEKAQIAIGFLTGDAQAAAETIEQLKTVAMDLAVPFESLVQADQKMTAFGFSAEQTSEALVAAANAAAATGNSFDQTAAAIERMSLSGMAGSRQLVQIGLSVKDLAEEMGVSVDKVKTTFSALDESLRTDVITGALAKWQGAAVTAADSTSGALTQMSNAWHLAMEEVGKAIAPAVVAVAHFATDTAYYFQIGIVAISAAVTVIADSFKALKDAATGNWGDFQAQMNAISTAERQAVIDTANLVIAHQKKTQATDEDTEATRKNVQAAVALMGAQEALLPVVLNVHHATRDFVELITTIPTAEKAAADSQDALNIKWTEQNKELGEAQAYLDQVLERYRQGQATAQEVAKALDTVNQTQAALNQTTAQFKLPEAFATWPAVLKQTQDELTALQQPLSVIPQYVRTAADALHDMGIKTDDAGHALQTLLAGYEELGTKTHTIDDENVAWEKISGSLAKLAKTDLPEVLKLYDEHLAQLQQLGASEGLVLQTQAKQLQTIIDIKTQSGASATQQIIDLNNVRLHQQALYDQTHLLGDLYVGIQNDILKGWDSMGKAIADNIIDGNNWGQTFLNVGKQVAKMILEEIVGSAFKALKDAIIGTSSSVVDLQGAFSKLAKSITDAFGSTASSGGGAVAGAAGAASGIGGAVSVVGAIGSIGTMISSIIGNFQMAKLETTMNAVEHNTRYLQIEAEKFFQVDEWQRHDEVLAHFDGIFQRLGDIWEAINTAATEVVTAIGGISSVGGSDKPAAAAAQGLSGGLASHLTDASASVPSAGAQAFSPVAPGGYGTMASPSSATYNNATTTSQSGPQNLTVNINEAGNARNTARELASVLKAMTPSYMAFAK